MSASIRPAHHMAGLGPVIDNSSYFSNSPRANWAAPTSVCNWRFANRQWLTLARLGMGCVTRAHLAKHSSSFAITAMHTAGLPGSGCGRLCRAPARLSAMTSCSMVCRRKARRWNTSCWSVTSRHSILLAAGSGREGCSYGTSRFPRSRATDGISDAMFASGEAQMPSSTTRMIWHVQSSTQMQKLTRQLHQLSRHGLSCASLRCMQTPGGS